MYTRCCPSTRHPSPPRLLPFFLATLKKPSKTTREGIKINRRCPPSHNKPRPISMVRLERHDPLRSMRCTQACLALDSHQQKESKHTRNSTSVGKIACGGQETTAKQPPRAGKKVCMRGIGFSRPKHDTFCSRSKGPRQTPAAQLSFRGSGYVIRLPRGMTPA